VGRIRLRARRPELDDVAWHCDLCGAEPLEDHGRRRARELGEPLRQSRRRAVLDHHVRVWMRPAEQLVADVTADDPGCGALIRGRLLEQAQDVLVGYWLIRAHSTAPTCP